MDSSYTENVVCPRRFLYTSRRGVISQEMGVFCGIVLGNEVTSLEMYRGEAAWTSKTHFGSAIDNGASLNRAGSRVVVVVILTGQCDVTCHPLTCRYLLRVRMPVKLAAKF